MKFNGKKILVIVVILALVIAIIGFAIKIIGYGEKEVVEARKFLQLLYDENIIEKKVNPSKIIFDKETKNSTQDNLTSYRVNCDEYGVGLDKDYNVINFTNKVIPVGESNITAKDGEALAEVYLRRIYNGKVKFKEDRSPQAKDGQFYLYSFYKYLDEYPLYQEEIVVGLDKVHGNLISYSNVYSYNDYKKPIIKIKEKDAIEIGIKAFNELNMNGKLIDSVELYIAPNEKLDELGELCYVFSVGGENMAKNKAIIKYFISTESGEIINHVNNMVPVNLAK